MTLRRGGVAGLGPRVAENLAVLCERVAGHRGRLILHEDNAAPGGDSACAGSMSGTGIAFDPPGGVPIGIVLLLRGMMDELFGALIDFWPGTVLLSLALLLYGWKRLRGSLRIFVMIAAGSVAGFLVAVFLHNAVYALSARWWGPPGLEEPVFFILAVIVCPLLLVVGVIGAVVVVFRSRSVHH